MKKASRFFKAETLECFLCSYSLPVQPFSDVFVKTSVDQYLQQFVIICTVDIPVRYRNYLESENQVVS